MAKKYMFSVVVHDQARRHQTVDSSLLDVVPGRMRLVNYGFVGMLVGNLSVAAFVFAYLGFAVLLAWFFHLVPIGRDLTGLGFGVTFLAGLVAVLLYSARNVALRAMANFSKSARDARPLDVRYDWPDRSHHELAIESAGDRIVLSVYSSRRNLSEALVLAGDGMLEHA